MEVDKEIEFFTKKVKEYKAGTSLNNWNRLVVDVPKILTSLLIHHQTGGSKRKPFLCISTLDSQNEKIFNNWNEKCINSVQFIINFSPWFADAVYAGYSVSEHTLHRIFERVISPNQLAQSSNPHYLFAGELKYAPLWSVFWIYASSNMLAKSEDISIYPIIPSPSGLFFAQIHSKKIHQVEIRTFVSNEMLFPEQLELREIMIDCQRKIGESTIGYFPSLAISGIKNQEMELSKFLDIIKPNISLLQEISRSRRVGDQLSDDVSAF